LRTLFLNNNSETTSSNFDLDTSIISIKIICWILYSKKGWFFLLIWNKKFVSLQPIGHFLNRINLNKCKHDPKCAWKFQNVLLKKILGWHAWQITCIFINTKKNFPAALNVLLFIIRFYYIQSYCIIFCFVITYYAKLCGWIVIMGNNILSWCNVNSG